MIGCSRWSERAYSAGAKPICGDRGGISNQDHDQQFTTLFLFNVAHSRRTSAVMDSSDEESEPNSGGSSAEEDEEMSEASEQDGSSDEKDSDTVKSKKKLREQGLKVPTTKKKTEAMKAKNGESSSAEEEETGDEEMSDGSEQDGSSDEKENDDVRTTTGSEEHESKKRTSMKRAQERGVSTAEEEVADAKMIRGNGQRGRFEVNETYNDKSNNESDGQKADKQTSVKMAKAKKKKGKTGVVYLSRIPPHLKPLKLRHLLSQYGEVSRVYLAPEDNAARIRRKRAGGNRGKNFAEGWVEFVHKRDAKRIAAVLNGEPVDPRKRSAYHFDLWTIKYLKRFKWDNLTAEMAYKKAARGQKIAAEISAAKKERDFYLTKVDQARAISSMEERKQKRKTPEANGSSATGDGERPDDGSAKETRFVRSFHQRKSVVDPAMETKSRLAADVLAGVFGNSTVK